MRQQPSPGLALSALLLAATACAASGDRPMAAPDGGGGEGVGGAGGAAGGTDAAASADAAANADAAASTDAAARADAVAIGDAGSDVPQGRCDPRDAGPSEEFRKIYETILRPTCGGAGRSCHTNELGSTKLDFNTLEKAFANLVNVPTALTCAAAQGWLRVRVVPFDPKASAVMYVKGDFCSYRHGSFGALWNIDLTPIESWILGGAR